MIPERKQAIEGFLRGYWERQGRFRALTRREWEWEWAASAELPTDSMGSARIDGMPHNKVAMISNPTLRIVLTREALRAKMVDMAEADRQEADMLADQIVLFTQLWATLDALERALIDALYWRGLSAERAVDHLLTLASDALAGYRIPTSRKSVERDQDRLLAKIDRIWGGVQF